MQRQVNGSFTTRQSRIGDGTTTKIRLTAVAQVTLRSFTCSFIHSFIQHRPTAPHTTTDSNTSDFSMPDSVTAWLFIWRQAPADRYRSPYSSRTRGYWLRILAHMTNSSQNENAEPAADSRSLSSRTDPGTDLNICWTSRGHSSPWQYTRTRRAARWTGWMRSSQRAAWSDATHYSLRYRLTEDGLR
jgi:hypothetical protein